MTDRLKQLRNGRLFRTGFSDLLAAHVTSYDLRDSSDCRDLVQSSVKIATKITNSSALLAYCKLNDTLQKMKLIHSS